MASLKIINTSFSTPKLLITTLQEIPQKLVKNNFQLTVKHSSTAKYLEIIELEAFQTQSGLVSILRTGLYHIIIHSKYVMRNDE